MDPIEELCARSKLHPELTKFLAFHRDNPGVLDFLVTEIRLRLKKGFGAFSIHSLMSYSRWKLEIQRGPGETFLLNDHLGAWYGRAILILHPEFNGRCECRGLTENEVFGVRLEDKKHSNFYARRLVWLDGAALEDGWRPTREHEVTRSPKRKPNLH